MGGVEVQERMVSFIGMGETPFRTEDPRARETVRVKGVEASHEELPRF